MSARVNKAQTSFSLFSNLVSTLFTNKFLAYFTRQVGLSCPAYVGRNTQWPVTSNDSIVLLSSPGTPVYGSHVLEGGDGGDVGIGTSFSEHFCPFPFQESPPNPN